MIADRILLILDHIDQIAAGIVPMDSGSVPGISANDASADHTGACVYHNVASAGQIDASSYQDDASRDHIDGTN